MANAEQKMISTNRLTIITWMLCFVKLVWGNSLQVNINSLGIS